MERTCGHPSEEGHDSHSYSYCTIGTLCAPLSCAEQISYCFVSSYDRLTRRRDMHLINFVAFTLRRRRRRDRNPVARIVRHGRSTRAAGVVIHRIRRRQLDAAHFLVPDRRRRLGCRRRLLGLTSCALGGEARLPLVALPRLLRLLLRLLPLAPRLQRAPVGADALLEPSEPPSSGSPTVPPHLAQPPTMWYAASLSRCNSRASAISTGAADCGRSCLFATTSNGLPRSLSCSCASCSSFRASSSLPASAASTTKTAPCTSA